MTDFLSDGWVAWSIGLIVVLPILILVLSEVHQSLQRRNSPLAGPVNKLRLWLLPLAALLILLTQAAQQPADRTGVRLVATLVGILAVTVALGGLNAVLFTSAKEGSWRERLPSIFVDLARLFLVVLGAAAVASFVWGADVGGLFAALGVGSIVIGLALQGAIGSVVSGLLLLFEQPFRIGDSLDVGGTKGRVVEMNWRSTHLDTGTGLHIIPNATIAGSSFANLSRPTEAIDVPVEVNFDAADPPHVVAACLERTARGLSTLRPNAEPSVTVKGGGTYQVMLPLPSARLAGSTTSQFLRWLWYSSRRDEVSLDGATFEQFPRERVIEAMRRVAPTLSLPDDQLEDAVERCEIELYGDGETIVAQGELAQRYAVTLSGHARTVALDHGGRLAVGEQGAGDVIGVSAFVREPSPASVIAVGVVEVLQVPLDLVDELSRHDPALARRFSQLAARRRAEVVEAREKAEAQAPAEVSFAVEL